MQIVGSNDITLLRVGVTFDISGPTPQILLENLSTGPDLPACSWWFEVFSPGEIPIHEGSESTPDIIGNWTEDTLNDNWPKAFNNILWSGAPYSFQAFVKDGDGNVYAGDVQTAAICRPAGNTKNSTNTYGLATALIEVKCADGRVYFQDTTNATYQGLTGTIGASILRVFYPPDETGVQPSPFVGEHFSTALVPITYSSDNYSYQSYSIYDYDMGGYVHIRIRYQSFNPVNGAPAVRFAVLCNINLCALFCEVAKLADSIESGNCANAQEAQQKLNLINPKLWMISMGIEQPLCGVDVPALIDQVKEIGGFECDCCNAPTGIIPTGSSIIDGYDFSVVTECGDISGTVEKNGNNIQFLLSDVKYVFEMCDGSPSGTTAFEIRPAIDGCVKTYCLFVDITQLSFDILNTIKTNGALVNLFNSIVQAQGAGGFQLIVNGDCIFQSSAACDYTITLTNIPTSTTFALLTSIVLNGVPQDVFFAFNKSNLPALQTYLNTLGLGSFTVLLSGPNIVILSGDNPNNITDLIYSVASITYLANLNKVCSGYLPLSANQVVQNIINYICALDDTQVDTSAAYEICYIDPADGTSKIETVESGAALTTFITALLTRGCQTIEYIQSLGTLDCLGIKEIFPETIALMQASDVFFGTKSGSCARITPVEAFKQMLTFGYYDPEVVSLFCAIADLCRGSKTCTLYSEFSAELIEFNEDCPLVVSFAVEGDTPPTVTQVQWGNAPTVGQTVFVEYQDASPDAPLLWVPAGSSSVTSNGNQGVLDVPVGLSGATPGNSYFIRVYNDCASPPNYSPQQGPYLMANV